MSDGPYRSLPMSRKWKRLAQFAENQNFEPSDICNAAIAALANDWGGDVPFAVIDGIRGVLLEPQGGLFPERRIDQLEAMRRMTAGHGFARLLIDCTGAVVTAGGAGESALIEATSRALLARASRGFRQVEEHYYRKATDGLARSVRTRLEVGIPNDRIDALARELLNITSVPAQRRSMKRQDLDDGVPL